IIVLEDVFQRTWQLTIQIPTIQDRPIASERWLAIDFGNTNTYAAVIHDGEEGQEILPVLGGDEPESFSSAIYFADVSQPEQPKYLVGPEASASGKLNP